MAHWRERLLASKNQSSAQPPLPDKVSGPEIHENLCRQFGLDPSTTGTMELQRVLEARNSKPRSLTGREVEVTANLTATREQGSRTLRAFKLRRNLGMEL